MLVEKIVNSISISDRKAIEKLTVRELDDEGKGNFLAFVDEKDASFDVHVSIDKFELKKHSCDCSSSKELCFHKLAVILEINRTEKVKKPKTVIRKKKSDPVDELVNSQESEKVNDWLISYLKKNKEAFLEFELAFTDQTQKFEVEDVKKSIDNVINSVLKRKRNGISASEMKKLVDLLALTVKPIEDYIIYNLISKESAFIFNALTRFLEDYRWEINTTSKRLYNFNKELGNRFAKAVVDLQVLEDYTSVVFQLWNRLLSKEKLLTELESYCLVIIYNLSNSDRRQLIAEHIFHTLKNGENIINNLPDSIAFNCLTILVDKNTFEGVETQFTPRFLQYDYNLLLARSVMQIDEDLAVEYMEEIIKRNSQEPYSYEFYRMLEKIYSGQELKDKTIEIRKKIFFSAPTFFTYIQIIEDLEDNNEILKFKTKVKNSLSRYDENELAVLIEIYGYERNWRKMMDIINQKTILPYFWIYKEQLFEFDKIQFLKEIMYNAQLPLKDFFSKRQGLASEVIEFLKTHYSKKEFEMVNAKFITHQGTLIFLLREVFSEL